jgi:hypothetical protein
LGNHLTLFNKRPHYVSGEPMSIDMIGAVLGIILDDDNDGVVLERARRYSFD